MDAPQPQQPQQIEVGLGEREAEGIYANLVFITHSQAEVVLDFARALPGLPKARVLSRIIMTPMHAKGMLQALQQNLDNYEKAHGAIHLPGEPPKSSGLGFTSRG